MEELTNSVILMYISLCLFIISIGIVIGCKVYRNINEQEFQDKGKVIQRIIKTYLLVQCVSWPLVLVLFGVKSAVIRSAFIVNHPSMTATFIHISNFIVKLTLMYVGFNSLIIAVCRYTFMMIVTHNDASNIKKIRQLIVIISIMVPIIITVLNEAFVPMSEYKIHLMPHQVEILETKMSSNTFCILQNTTLIIRQSLIYDDIQDLMPQSFLRPLKDVVCIINFAACSNIFEAVFYTHIFWYNKR